jgi:D-arabinose 1-dehydrogenase-like Zn-dependent alcohol dehydrogenase
MTALRRFSLTAYDAPLCETVVDCPQPKDAEVVVRIDRCGVCHSDLHIQDGRFALGGGNCLDIRAGRTLPFTLGHEIAGTVESVGPNAQGVSIGAKVAVFPWIGCRRCAACDVGEENLCQSNRHLGVSADGGFASHVLVPHPRYLLDHGPLPPSFAGALMCSGLTAYAALKRLAAHARRGPVLLVGLGGVGMMGLAIARTLFPYAPIVAEIDPAKREAALQAGAGAAYDPAAPEARRALIKASGGGVFAACDFVGSEQSLAFATGALAKGGKVVVTGLLGGAFPLPATMFVLKAMTVEGTLIGTLDEARELLDLAKAGKLASPPIRERPMAEVQAALDDLRAGRVFGRIVLTG